MRRLAETCFVKPSHSVVDGRACKLLIELTPALPLLAPLAGWLLHGFRANQAQFVTSATRGVMADESSSSNDDDDDESRPAL